MARPEEIDAFRALLEGVSALEVRELSVTALRQWRSKSKETTFSLHDNYGRYLVALLAQRKGGIADLNALKEVVIESQHEAWMSPIVEFVWWFIRAGFAAPLAWDRQNLVRLQLLERGCALLDANETDHPFVPGLAGRLKTRCPGLPDGAVALLLDAETCMEVGLLRPATMLMGLAYEVTVEAVVLSLLTRVPSPIAQDTLEKSAAARIDRVRQAIPTLLPGSGKAKDDREAAVRAVDFADDLRRRRNDASHTTPSYGFSDRAETEELFVSAARNLPNLWRLA